MLTPPFEILECSWPCPVEQKDNRWVSEPDWNLPRMPFQPQPFWEMVGDELGWMIDWRQFFQGQLKVAVDHQSGEMREFYLVFRLRIHQAGRLIFWDDDGSIIRRNGVVIHADRSAHRLQRNEISVAAAEELEIAQWQARGGWLWGARLERLGWPPSAAEILSPFREIAMRAMSQPNGPALKLLCSGKNPWRTIICLYSMLLNGYRPAQVYLFGENQWSPAARRLFSEWLPFAEIVPLEAVAQRLRSLGQPSLVEFVRQHFFVMKLCVCLLYPPTEFCLMDDDVFILASVEQALDNFQRCDLVFAADADYTERYLPLWDWLAGARRPLPTGTFNSGLYWMRNAKDPHQIASHATRVSPQRVDPMSWDQGLIAATFAQDKVLALPTNRYFYPVFDGLPGGLFGYDYAANPCGFVSIHFGGLFEKPSDAATLLLATDILSRQTAMAGI